MPRMNDWSRLTGPQRRIITDALLESFSEGDLATRLAFTNLNYNAIKEGETYEQRAANLVEWHRQHGKITALVGFLQDNRPDNPWVRELPAGLDAVAVAAVASGSGTVSAQSRELQRQIAGSQFSDIRLWLTRVAMISQRVCLIMAGPAAGTGFLVGPDLVLTAGHVVQKIEKSDIKGCLFDFARDANGTSDGRTVAFAETWRVAFAPPDPTDEEDTGVPAPKNLDFGIIRLAEAVADDDLSGTPRGFETANTDGDIQTGAPLLIAQHPMRQPMQLSLGGSLGLFRGDLRLHYTASTLKGSSGSPVFDGKMRLVALHHAGDPTGLTATYNAGVPIGLIRSAAGLET